MDKNLIGTADADTIQGGVENNLIFGLDGDDTLVGDPFGNNEPSPIDARAADSIDGGNGNDLIWGDGNGTTGNYFHVSGPDTITGGPGDDTIHGGASADQIDGGEGNDMLGGPSSGSTLYLGGAGDDTIDQHNFHNGDDTLFGGDGNDVIVSYGSDRINGNTGDDAITDYGKDGVAADTISGGQGNDGIALGMTEADNFANGNMGNDTITGGLGNETLRGGQNDDVIVGGGGNDWIFGDLGNDTLTGGRGTDLFVTTGTDAITDFNSADGDRVITIEQFNAGGWMT